MINIFLRIFFQITHKFNFPKTNFGDRTYLQYVGFEILTAVVIKNSGSWDIMSCRSLKVDRRFGGTHRSILSIEATNQCEAGSNLLGLSFEPEDTGEHVPSKCWFTFNGVCLPPASYWFLLGLVFDTEGGGDMFLRNIGCLSADYTALRHRR
jgi:hypothetical protein